MQFFLLESQQGMFCKKKAYTIKMKIEFEQGKDFNNKSLWKPPESEIQSNLTQ